MSYDFLCKRGIRPARTEQFLVIIYFFAARINFPMQSIGISNAIMQSLHVSATDDYPLDIQYSSI